MPKIYRAMLSDSGRPVIGAERNMLGIRTPPDEPADIIPDGNGNVGPNLGGMSVNPSISFMLPVHWPKRWHKQYPQFKGARGGDGIEVFMHGDGEFMRAPITDDLQLRPDGPKHGVVEPAREMALNQYVAALASTQNDWRLLTDPDGS
jgi:hypothetical protein